MNVIDCYKIKGLETKSHLILDLIYLNKLLL